jgi:hypothetical protein
LPAPTAVPRHRNRPCPTWAPNMRRQARWWKADQRFRGTRPKSSDRNLQERSGSLEPRLCSTSFQSTRCVRHANWLIRPLRLILVTRGPTATFAFSVN